MEEKLTLFRKGVKLANGGEKDTYFVKTSDNESFSVRLTNEAKNQIIRSGLQFPLEIVLKPEDYFFTVDKYKNPDGVQMEFDIAVIESFTSIAKANIVSKTFRDMVNKRKGNDGLPF